MSTTAIRGMFRLAAIVLLGSPIGLATAADDVPVQDLRIGDDAHKRYFLIGLDKKAKPPAEGYGLLIVLQGGHGWHGERWKMIGDGIAWLEKPGKG